MWERWGKSHKKVIFFCRSIRASTSQNSQNFHVLNPKVDLPGIPIIGASVILICRLECDLSLCVAIKDSLGSHLNF